jgi:hypothetical protein
MEYDPYADKGINKNKSKGKQDVCQEAKKRLPGLDPPDDHSVYIKCGRQRKDNQTEYCQGPVFHL